MAKQSRWVQHLKNYSKQNNISYQLAMKSKEARQQYNKQKGGNCAANLQQQGGNPGINESIYDKTVTPSPYQNGGRRSRSSRRSRRSRRQRGGVCTLNGGRSRRRQSRRQSRS